MKKLIALALVLVLAIACLASCGGDKKDESKPAESKPAVSVPEESKQPEISDTSDPVDDVSKPADDTSDPDVSGPDDDTSRPDEQPKELANVDESGSIRKEYAKTFALILDYSVKSVSDGKLVVTAKVSLESCQLKAGARKDLGSISVGDQTLKFSTDPIDYDGEKRQKLEFAEKSFTLDRAEGDTEFDISASWLFNGVYGETEVGTMEASAHVTVKADGSVKVVPAE